MEELIAEMRERIQNRPGRRYDGVLKADILALVAEMRTEGTSKKGIEKALGTNWTTIESWMEKPKTVVPVVVTAPVISAPGGQRVPLGQVAQVLLDEGPAVVSRESAQRRMTIQVNVRNRDLASFVADAQEQIREKGNLPAGYFVTWGGQFENLEAATARLAVAVPSALLLIFLLLFTTFGSVRPALIIYLNIPMAAVGGVLALWLRGMPFSISAAVGFIALSGIAVLNGVVMVSYIRDLQREGLSLSDATEKGARLRLRAVLMTALTDGIGFLPMAISTTAGAEVQRPLATVVIGGLITATLLTLLVLPAVYSWLGGEIGETTTEELNSDGG